MSHSESGPRRGNWQDATTGGTSEANMAKRPRKATTSRPDLPLATLTPVKVDGPSILVEHPSGGKPYEFYVTGADEVPDHQFRVVLAGQIFEHCAEAADGRWVYRARPF